MFFAEEGLPEMRRVTAPSGKGVVIIFGPMEPMDVVIGIGTA